MEDYEFPEFEENDIFINEFEASRFADKMHLDTFTFDLNNSFEPTANKEILRLITEIEKYNSITIALDNKITKEMSEDEIMEIELEKHYYFIDIEYLKEEIWALIEMKVIYEFKSLELNIKKLIRTSFADTKTNDFYKWDSLNSFLKSKNIKPEKLKGYNEIIQLKDINNALKHSGEFSVKLRTRIPEFRNKRNVDFNDLNTFYNRVKIFPNIYIEGLASAIYTEMYVFNEQKIDKIANNIANRMEKNDVDLLIEAIKSKY